MAELPSANMAELDVIENIASSESDTSVLMIKLNVFDRFRIGNYMKGKLCFSAVWRILLPFVLLATWQIPGHFAAELDGGFVVILPEEIAWDETSDRVQQRILFGNPSESGLYIIRVRFPDGGSSMPHFHSTDRFITVIEGVWHAGTDASHDMTRTTAIPAGGYMMHPAGATHYDGSRGGPVVVEIRGMGPVETTSVEITP